MWLDRDRVADRSAPSRQPFAQRASLSAISGADCRASGVSISAARRAQATAGGRRRRDDHRRGDDAGLRWLRPLFTIGEAHRREPRGGASRARCLAQKGTDAIDNVNQTQSRAMMTPPVVLDELRHRSRPLGSSARPAPGCGVGSCAAAFCERSGPARTLGQNRSRLCADPGRPRSRG